MYMTMFKYTTQISVHLILPLSHENRYILATLSEKNITMYCAHYHHCQLSFLSNQFERGLAASSQAIVI